MAFYENTIIAKQDLSEKDIKNLIIKYDEVIKNSSGKVLKIEEWGLLSLSKKINNYKKGFFIHIKFEGVTDSKRAFIMGNALVVGVVEKIGKSLSKIKFDE